MDVGVRKARGHGNEEARGTRGHGNEAEPHAAVATIL